VKTRRFHLKMLPNQSLPLGGDGLWWCDERSNRILTNLYFYIHCRPQVAVNKSFLLWAQHQIYSNYVGKKLKKKKLPLRFSLPRRMALMFVIIVLRNMLCESANFPFAQWCYYTNRALSYSNTSQFSHSHWFCFRNRANTIWWLVLIEQLHKFANYPPSGLLIVNNSDIAGGLYQDLSIRRFLTAARTRASKPQNSAYY
jgi:hypothetical protein